MRLKSDVQLQGVGWDEDGEGAWCVIAGLSPIQAIKLDIAGGDSAMGAL